VLGQGGGCDMKGSSGAAQGRVRPTHPSPVAAPQSNPPPPPAPCHRPSPPYPPSPGLDAFIVVRQFRPAVYAARCRDAAEKGAPPPPKDAGAARGAGRCARRPRAAGAGAGRRPASWGARRPAAP
jgi:hypothetical protein